MAIDRMAFSERNRPVQFGRTTLLQICTALLITGATALIIIEVSVRFGMPVDNLDLLVAITNG
jgi:hypothetical protein